MFTMHASEVLGLQIRRFWDVYEDAPARAIFWLGAGAQEWVRGWLADGWIAHACVHRIPGTGHGVVLLEAGDEGVLLMDPIYGHVTEPWEWFLGRGSGNHGAHFIEGWYRA